MIGSPACNKVNALIAGDKNLILLIRTLLQTAENRFMKIK